MVCCFTGFAGGVWGCGRVRTTAHVDGCFSVSRSEHRAIPIPLSHTDAYG